MFLADVDVTAWIQVMGSGWLHGKISDEIVMLARWAKNQPGLPVATFVVI
jgi:hypothetical protein